MNKKSIKMLRFLKKAQVNIKKRKIISFNEPTHVLYIAFNSFLPKHSQSLHRALFILKNKRSTCTHIHTRAYVHSWENGRMFSCAVFPIGINNSMMCNPNREVHSSTNHIECAYSFINVSWFHELFSCMLWNGFSSGFYY